MAPQVMGPRPKYGRQARVLDMHVEGSGTVHAGRSCGRARTLPSTPAAASTLSEAGPAPP